MRATKRRVRMPPNRNGFFPRRRLKLGKTPPYTQTTGQRVTRSTHIDREGTAADFEQHRIGVGTERL